jgi:hypothetical protein
MSSSKAILIEVLGLPVQAFGGWMWLDFARWSTAAIVRVPPIPARAGPGTNATKIVIARWCG